MCTDSSMPCRTVPTPVDWRTAPKLPPKPVMSRTVPQEPIAEVMLSAILLLDIRSFLRQINIAANNPSSIATSLPPINCMNCGTRETPLASTPTTARQTVFKRMRTIGSNIGKSDSKSDGSFSGFRIRASARFCASASLTGSCISSV